tara:strand:+ start:29858 stop:31096 length:1239 start_codon:yes stop_codon:yes gene_type:complete
MIQTIKFKDLLKELDSFNKNKLNEQMSDKEKDDFFGDWSFMDRVQNKAQRSIDKKKSDSGALENPPIDFDDNKMSLKFQSLFNEYMYSKHYQIIKDINEKAKANRQQGYTESREHEFTDSYEPSDGIKEAWSKKRKEWFNANRSDSGYGKSTDTPDIPHPYQDPDGESTCTEYGDDGKPLELKLQRLIPDPTDPRGCKENPAYDPGWWQKIKDWIYDTFVGWMTLTNAIILGIVMFILVTIYRMFPPARKLMDVIFGLTFIKSILRFAANTTIFIAQLLANTAKFAYGSAKKGASKGPGVLSSTQYNGFDSIYNKFTAELPKLGKTLKGSKQQGLWNEMVKLIKSPTVYQSNRKIFQDRAEALFMESKITADMYISSLSRRVQAANGAKIRETYRELGGDAAVRKAGGLFPK